MPKLDVSRSIVIQSPIKTVRDSLSDYKQWPKWSPWLIMEPEAELTFSESQGQAGSSYAWQGKITGEGNMVLKSVSTEKLEMDLQFIKPFKSQAKVFFHLQPLDNDSTKVTWIMDSKLPFFMFWMVRSFEAYIGMDYERGLKMLKDYLETGAVPSKIDIHGETTLKGSSYFGLSNECSLEKIDSEMTRDFEKLYEFIEANNLPKEIPPFTLYNSFDLVKRHTDYVVGYPHNDSIELKPNLFKDDYSEQKVFKVTHIGRYDHLANAWSAAISYCRANKIKIKKKPVGFEFYINDPETTPEAELITEVLIPLR